MECRDCQSTENLKVRYGQVRCVSCLSAYERKAYRQKKARRESLFVAAPSYVCSVCLENLPAENFRPSDIRIHYHVLKCRQCKSAYESKTRSKHNAGNPENHERRKYVRKAYYENNKEAFKSLSREHYVQNVKIYDFWRAKSRARKAGATQFMSLEEWETIRDSSACHWCQCDLHRSFTEMDHVIPLCEGGQHTVENVVASCSNCNARREWERKALLPSSRHQDVSRKEN